MNQRSSWGRRGVLTGMVGLGAAAAGLGVAWLRSGSDTALPTGAEQAFWSLSLRYLDGSPVVLKGFADKPLLINFWATWCPPCVEELPLLDAFYQENKFKSWQVLAIAIDKHESVERFLAQMPLSMPIVVAGPAGIALTQSLGNQQGGLPFSVLFGRDGRVLRHKIGKLSSSDLGDWHKLAG